MSGLYLTSDTIVAIATAPGRGALAIVRLSGPAAHAIAGSVVRPWPLEPGRQRLCAAVDATESLLDRPVVAVYRAPRSYTGEDVVEVTTHGGAVAAASVVAALVAAGARPALPGEFTRRALLNGKMDLAQAEAVGDLIDARSTAMQRAAVSQMDGGLSRRVRALRDAVLDVEALVAYDIDFPEEDDGPVPAARVAAAACEAAERIDQLLATAPAGELIRTGAVVVIAGPPNVGKSSLFNALLGRARSIVSAVPGTTRDAIDAVIEPAGAPFPLQLIDTAGLRDATDAIEQLGIEVSRQTLVRAHIVLACGETVGEVADTVERVQALTTAPVIGVRTKCDEFGGAAADSDQSRSCADGSGSGADIEPVATSAETGEGLRTLLDEVVRVVTVRWQVPSPDAPLVTKARHRLALERAAAELDAFRTAWSARALPAVVAAVHLRAAATALEDIIGAIDASDVLERVFGQFCVGK